MSIRVEDAAEEASRFSLRTSVLGTAAPTAPTAARLATAPLQRSQPHAIAFTVPPQTAQVAQMAHAGYAGYGVAAPPATQMLSFNSLVTRPAQATAAPAGHPLVRDPLAAARALEAISHAQRRGVAAATTHAAAPLTALIGGNRTLQAGYISGGSMRDDPRAELMRLSATVDTLQNQLGAQTERLQKTEASLMRANRSMTSERAAANARLVRMQTELQDARARETKLRETAASQMLRDTVPSQPSFNESVKRVEEFDALISKLKEDLQVGATERDALAAKLSALTEQHGELSEKHSTDTAAADNVRAQLEVTKADCVALAKTRAALEGELADTTAQRDEAMAASIDPSVVEALRVECSAALVARDALEAKLAEARDECAALSTRLCTATTAPPATDAMMMPPEGEAPAADEGAAEEVADEAAEEGAVAPSVTGAMMMPEDEAAPATEVPDEATEEAAEAEAAAESGATGCAADIDVSSLRATIDALTKQKDALQTRCDALSEAASSATAMQTDAYSKHYDRFLYRDTVYQPRRVLYTAGTDCSFETDDDVSFPTPSGLPAPLAPTPADVSDPADTAVPAAPSAPVEKPARRGTRTIAFRPPVNKVSRFPVGCNGTGITRVTPPRLFDTAASADDADVQKLVDAIHTDLMDAVTHHRRRYLMASGLTEEEAIESITELTGNA